MSTRTEVFIHRPESHYKNAAKIPETPDGTVSVEEHEMPYHNLLKGFSGE